MPHSTRYSTSGSSRLNPGELKATVRTSMEKFPDLVLDGPSQMYSSPNTANGNSSGGSSGDQWQSRKDSVRWARDQASTGNKGHSRQKSLSDAFRSIRTRKGSVSANVHEISDALKAPVSPKLVVSTPLSFLSSKQMLILARYCA